MTPAERTVLAALTRPMLLRELAALTGWTEYYTYSVLAGLRASGLVTTSKGEKVPGRHGRACFIYRRTEA